ncbi:hypothetical protein [Aquimarina algicola]|uniref:Lipoprotein n=1 Tax=Aquimarina algicola TaxID=2589995 RepID=A0A504JR86_9FLAO|nr:hypothetical protein [Aquimarina algicola]TPN88870.1 hypothetical protein FHK87_01255 [Aquimarina algicola]
MKNSIFTLGLFACLSIVFVGCQNNESEVPETQELQNFTIQEAKEQFVEVKDVSNTPETSVLLEELISSSQNPVNAKRVGCVLDSDIGCGSDAAAEIEEYINTSNCIAYNRGTLIFPVEAEQFTYSYSYYVDSDSDINMDLYQFQFDAHVADIQNRISPKKIAFISAVASNRCGGRGFKVSNVTYTVILGN